MNKKPCLLFVGPMQLPIPSEKGAVEEIIWQTAKRLKTNYSVFIFNPIERNILSMTLKTTVLLMHKLSTCIIHSHNLFASIMLTQRKLKWRHIITLHYPPNIAKSEIRKKLFLALLKYLTSRGAIITVPSWHIKNYLLTVGLRNVVFIPNGVDTLLFSPTKRSEELREKLLGDKELLLVSVGRIHPEKNQLTLVKAIKDLVYNYHIKNFKLLLIGPRSGTFKKSGDNMYYRILIDFIKKHELEHYVIFLDLPRREVAQVLASSDLYIHPSIVEAAAPLAVLEAMASKLPIIAFDLPFYKYYLINSYNSLLVPKVNYKLLASAVLMPMEDDVLRKKMAENSYSMATQHFSWDNIVRQYSLLYEILQ
jgi:glycosyltransferase involved in cell wall biosynthesis